MYAGTETDRNGKQEIEQDMKQSHKDTGEEQRFAQQLRDAGNILRPGFPCGQQRDGGRDGTREAEKYHAGLCKDTDSRNGNRAQRSHHDQVGGSQETHEYTFHRRRQRNVEIFPFIGGLE